MNNTEITLLKLLCSSKNLSMEKEDLKEKSGVGKWQFNAMLRRLVNQKYIEKDSLYATMADTTEAMLLVNLSKKYDLQKLLRNSNDVILNNLSDGVVISKLIKKTSLSRATIYRALKDFEDLGIIQRTIALVNDNDLKLFSYAKEMKEMEVKN